MNLDPRIKSKLDILTCFDIKKAKEFVGQKGYFANGLYCFSVLETCYYDTLAEVEDGDTPFKDDGCCYWNLFIPESFLKSKEKKYRPYTFKEFTEKFIVGQPIKFRPKGEVGWEHYLILNGYVHEQREDQTFTYIYIGSVGYTLDELFNAYEWQAHYTKDFEPFGVEK